MRKHKGLLRVDLRSNAEGLSGVLQMMPKSSAHSALKPDPSQVSDHAGLTLLGEARSTANSQQGQERRHPQHQQGLLTGGGIQCEHGSQHQLQSEGTDRSSGHESSQKTPGPSSRRGLVPKFTAGSQHVRQQADKENSNFDGAQGVSRQSSRAAGPKASARPVSAKPKAAAGTAKAVRRPSTAHPAAQTFDFGSRSQLQSQPTANMSQFAAATGAARPGVMEEGESATASFSGGYLADTSVHHAHRLLDNAAVGSASFDQWAGPASHHHQHAQTGSLYTEHMLASEQFKRHSTTGTACPAHRTVSFQEHQAQSAADQDMFQQQAATAMAGNAAADAAADNAYLHGVAEAFREVQVAEEEGRSRAAADHAIWSQAAAGCETDYEPDELLPQAQHSSTAALRERSAGMMGPNFAQPVRTQQVMSGRQAQQQARAGPKAMPRQALAADQAMLRSYGHPDVADRSGATVQVAGRAANPEGDAESRMTDQALSTAAAAMEAAKLNVWKAEVMCEIEGLKSSLEGQAVERHRYASCPIKSCCLLTIISSSNACCLNNLHAAK